MKLNKEAQGVVPALFLWISVVAWPLTGHNLFLLFSFRIWKVYLCTVIRPKMKARRFYYILFTIAAILWIRPQASSQVVFREPILVANLMNRFLAYNIDHSQIPGWKIQIISTTDRREMDEVRNRFVIYFPGIPITWKHVAPNYQVRVGSFRTKTELMSQMQDIRKRFPMSSPVIDMIDKGDLIDYD